MDTIPLFIKIDPSKQILLGLLFLAPDLTTPGINYNPKTEGATVRNVFA